LEIDLQLLAIYASPVEILIIMYASESLILLAKEHSK